MENQKNYRITKHQSELAVRVVGKIECTESIPLEVEGTDRDDLMVNWVRELLYLYQGSGYLLKEFLIREVKDTFVKADVRGEKIDPDRHEVQQEIAAVASHKSRMQQTGSQWTAHLIFEI